MISKLKLFIKQWRCEHERTEVAYQDTYYRDICDLRCLDCGLTYPKPRVGSTRAMLKHMAGGKYETPFPQNKEGN